MSGDVQPRKRKDKKRKKDEPSLEEHRGTAATFGEGDVQMHSQHDHGTGGHWCAKIIFFSLLAVLVTLIGLIILENRGLTELEANSVESQYSGILDGWIEDTPEDDHHDEHTLELKHHETHDDIDEHESENDKEFGEESDDQDIDDDEHNEEFEQDEIDDEDNDDDVEDGDDDDNEDEDENESNAIDEDDENQDKDDSQEDENDQEELNNEDDSDEIEERNVRSSEQQGYSKLDDDEVGDEDEDDDDDDNELDNDFDGYGNLDDATAVLEDNNDSKEDTGEDDDDKDDLSNEIANNDDDIDNTPSVENGDDNEENSEEDQNNEDEAEHEEDNDEEAEEEIEKIEKEVLDQEEPDSTELPLPDVSASAEKEEELSMEVVNPDEEYEVDDKEFLEVDEIDEPAVERIAPPPPGKPFVEIEDEVSTEIPPDTLAEEEEYEKQQEELRQQEAQSTQMWLKLAVGGALLVATHAVIRRVTAPRDAPESEQDEHANREETPLTDRRMTLIPEETSKVIPTQNIRPKVEEEIVQKVSSEVKTSAVPKQDSEEVDEDVVADEEVEEDEAPPVKKNDTKNKELYSDEEEDEDDEDVDEEEELEEKKEAPKSILKVSAVKKETEPEEVPDDVEIIDDDQIEEEIEEEVEDEEEISDVDDAELLSRLEAKYGRIPEPERPGYKHKDGGNSLEYDWPGEPSDPYWREQLEKAEQELRQGAYGVCEERVSAAPLADSGRARWLRARALDQLAEARRDNRVLARAVAAYMQLLNMNEQLSDKKLLQVALRTIDRIHFRGTYLNAEPVYRLLIRRFPNDVNYRNNLTISYLMANRADLASEVLKETLRLWPNDRVALAHYGFVLKTEQNKLAEAVTYFQRALEGDAGPANEPRFYYHLGDALLMLGRKEEALEVHKRGAELGHFLSPSQRSLYNVPRLKSQPWWDVKTTPYAKLARELESSWREILKEGEAAQSLYEKEKEGLKERGEWSQLDLFVRGREVPGRCARAPTTCRIVKTESAAQCRRGQVKFSLLSGGTHVRAHVGPTNCRLRMHLALSNTDNTFIRVDQEIRQWEVGKVLMFDDSFEHEVWHNGTRDRLVLIVDVWHPALTPHERRSLPAI